MMYDALLWPPGTVKTMDAEPAAVGDVDNLSCAELLVSCTDTPAGGAGWPRMITPTSCRFLPIGIPPVTVSDGVLTSATREEFAAGVLRPAGATALSVDKPWAFGLNCV